MKKHAILTFLSSLIFTYLIFSEMLNLRNSISTSKLGAIGIIGGADGPTAIFISSSLVDYAIHFFGLAILLWTTIAFAKKHKNARLIQRLLILYVFPIIYWTIAIVYPIVIDFY